MALTKKQQFILYSLGRWYLEANKKLKEQPLEIAISKAVFIDLIKKAHITERDERTLYKHLETLEKKKIVSYKNKNLSLTARGRRLFEEINKELLPFTTVLEILKAKDPLSYSRKAQTIFK